MLLTASRISRDTLHHNNNRISKENNIFLLTEMLTLCLQTPRRASLTGNATPMRVRMIAYKMLRKMDAECLKGVHKKVMKGHEDLKAWS